MDAIAARKKRSKKAKIYNVVPWRPGTFFFLWSIGPHVTKFAIFGFHRLANAPTGLIFWSFFLVSDYMGSERISGHVVPKSTIRAGHRIKVSDTENPI